MINWILGGLVAVLTIYNVVKIIKNVNKGGCNGGCSGCTSSKCGESGSK